MRGKSSKIESSQIYFHSHAFALLRPTQQCDELETAIDALDKKREEMTKGSGAPARLSAGTPERLASAEKTSRRSRAPSELLSSKALAEANANESDLSFLDLLKKAYQKKRLDIINKLPPEDKRRILINDRRKLRKLLINDRRKLENDISEKFNGIVKDHRMLLGNLAARTMTTSDVNKTMHKAVQLINGKAALSEPQFKLDVKLPPNKNLSALKTKKLQALQGQLEKTNNALFTKLKETSRTADKIKEIWDSIIELQELSTAIQNAQVEVRAPLNKEAVIRQSTQRVKELQIANRAQLDDYDSRISALDKEIADDAKGEEKIDLSILSNDTIQDLITSGKRDEHGNNILHHIVETRPQLLKKFIATAGAKELINQINSNGLSPLAMAAMKLDIDSVTILLQNGGDISQAIPLQGIGMQPLEINNDSRNPEGSVLAQCPCKVNRVRYDRLSLVELMIVMEPQTTEKDKGKYRNVFKELCDHTADLNTGSSKLPPLTLAAITSSPTAVEVLVNQKKPVKKKVSFIARQQTKAVDVNQTNVFDGRTAAHLSVGSLSPATTKILASANIDPNIPDIYSVSVAINFTKNDGEIKFSNHPMYSNLYNTEFQQTFGATAPFARATEGSSSTLYSKLTIPTSNLLFPLAAPARRMPAALPFTQSMTRTNSSSPGTGAPARFSAGTVEKLAAENTLHKLLAGGFRGLRALARATGPGRGQRRFKPTPPPGTLRSRL
jgi:hypothetical protein